MPTAYFITFATYGSRLHGDERGTVDSEHRQPGAPQAPANARRQAANRAIMAEPAFLLEPRHRELVREAISTLADHRQWKIEAMHVGQSHVHLVILAESHEPEIVASQCKAWSTRRLRESGSIGDRQRVWARMASTRYLNTDAGHAAAIDYVTRFQ
ncbi:MAG: transposase [Phycisphaerales bacterium JB064]